MQRAHQTQFDCEMPVTKKSTPETHVTEIFEHEENSTIRYDHAPIICEFQPAIKLPSLEPSYKKFKVQYPTVDPNVTRVREPLPFPEKLKDVIAWTDAFVDRIASLTAKEEEKNERHMVLLANEINRLRNALEDRNVELTNTRNEQETAKADLAKKEAELKDKTTLAETREKTIEDLQDAIAKEITDHHKEIADERKKYDILQAANKDLIEKLAVADKKALEDHKKWAKENMHHQKDHKELDRANNENKQLKAANKGLEADLDKAREREIMAQRKTKTADEAAKKIQEGLKVELQKARQDFADVSDKFDEESKKTAQLHQQVTTLDSKLEAAQKERETARAELAAAAEKYKALEMASAATEKKDKEMIAKLNGEKAKAKKDTDGRIQFLQTQFDQVKKEYDDALEDKARFKGLYDGALARIGELEMEIQASQNDTPAAE